MQFITSAKLWTILMTFTFAAQTVNAEPELTLVSQDATVPGQCDLQLSMLNETHVFLHDQDTDVNTFPEGLTFFGSTAMDTKTCTEISGVPACGPIAVDGETYEWAVSLTVPNGSGELILVELDSTVSNFSAGSTIEYDCCSLLADFDGNGTVQTADLLTFLLYFGTATDENSSEFDFNDSGTIDVLDLLTVLNAFGTDCED